MQYQRSTRELKAILEVEEPQLLWKTRGYILLMLLILLSVKKPKSFQDSHDVI